MPKTLLIEVPAGFNFRSTVYSHGWCELLPFELDDQNWRLSYVFSDAANGRNSAAVLYERDGSVAIELANGKVPDAKVLRDARHILRLDDDLSGFYGKLVQNEALAWVSKKSAGRLLRSPTVWEDLVKTMCTTNCSWALTKIMVRNLVEKLGAPAGRGKFAFPTAQAMANIPEQFYRDEIRAGYRSPYFIELAEKVASGKLDPEAWLESDFATPELKKEIKSVKGCGDYAAENLLKLLGRYDGLALDSWLRSQFYKKHNREKVCKDKKIERHYSRYGEWRGLAIWCDMTERWIV
jgi:3-methyladenine DNA glycosylase/8-oxoguanine DNA glycosylase